MTLFMTLDWDWFGGGGIFLITLCYGAVFFASGYLLWQKEGFKTPGGLLTTVAICMTPLAIFGLEKYMGIWPSGDPGDYIGYFMWAKGSWFFMEIGTVLVGLIGLRFVHFHFMTAPIAASLWFLAMDFTPLLFGELDFTWQQKCWVSIFFGLVLLLCSYFIDRRSRRDFAFWGYLFGTMTFWGGFSLLALTSELNWFLYFFISLAMMVSSIFLERNVLMIFGTLGIFNYLGHLAYQAFENSIVFPFALSIIGIIIVGLGIFYQKNNSLIKKAIVALLPQWLQKFLPSS
jgi:hypothetical protein